VDKEMIKFAGETSIVTILVSSTLYSNVFFFGNEIRIYIFGKIDR